VSGVLAALAALVAAIGAGLVGAALGARRERARTDAARTTVEANLARVDAASEATLERDLAAIPPPSTGQVSPERRAELEARWRRR
jgi:uncharacterized protein HemX